MVSTMSEVLNSPEAAERAADLEAYRRRVIEERWLSTLILSVHLEVEAMLEVLLSTARGPEPRRQRDIGFAKKLSQCQASSLLDVKLAPSLGALNTLRNELAHTLKNRPSSDSIYRFIETMSAMHPLQVSYGAEEAPVRLVRFEDVQRHFSGAGAEDLEHFVFFSLMLLRASVSAHLQAGSIHGEQRA